MAPHTLVFDDRVYGVTEIDHPLLIELIECPTMQRLKGIDQSGYFEPHFPGTKHSRFEHSIGVCLLLKRFKASLEEQVAGLIHDVSHSAFSHCIDYVLKTGSPEKHDHQDNVFETYVRSSEIPEILGRYGINVEFVLNDRNFPLKENELPDLCADRIDYSLRSARVFRDLLSAEKLLHHLTTEDGTWLFRDYATARQFAEGFKTLNDRYWAGFPSAIMFQTVGDYLKHALQRGYITENDLYTTDAEVLAKIGMYLPSDPELRKYFDRMNKRTRCKNDPEDFDYSVACKSRVVDPLCLRDRRIMRVSEIDEDWKVIVQTEMKPKRYYLKFEDSVLS